MLLRVCIALPLLLTACATIESSQSPRKAGGSGSGISKDRQPPEGGDAALDG